MTNSSTNPRANTGSRTADDTGTVTALLRSFLAEDSQVNDDAMLDVYEELCSLARHHLKRERRNHTLDTRALVHEAWMKLSDQRQVVWQNRHHFYGIAAATMRRILCDYARQRAALKRGGSNAIRIRLADMEPGVLRVDEPGLELMLSIHDALARLEKHDPVAARMIELRYYAGMTLEEISNTLDVPLRTLSRRWRFARAWLLKALES